MNSLLRVNPVVGDWDHQRPSEYPTHFQKGPEEQTVHAYPFTWWVRNLIPQQEKLTYEKVPPIKGILWNKNKDQLFKLILKN